MLYYSSTPRSIQHRYGNRWLKTLYRGYINVSFSERTLQPLFQGSQGPTICAEVGDLIETHFVNQLKYHYATMHSMGLAYTKPYEGSDHRNNTMPGVGITLPIADSGSPMLGPEDRIVYKWMVNDEAGPSNVLQAKIYLKLMFLSLLMRYLISDTRSIITITSTRR